MRKILLASAFFAPLFFGAAHAQAPVVGPCYNGVACNLGTAPLTAGSANVTGASAYQIGGITVLNSIFSAANDYMTLVGGNAGLNISTAAQETTCVGWTSCGSASTGMTGPENTLVGWEAGGFMVSGQFNTAVGVNSQGTEQVSGTNNVSVGADSMRDSSNPGFSVAIGANAMKDSDTSSTTAVGAGAMIGNPSAHPNGGYIVAIGEASVNGANLGAMSYVTAVGALTGQNLTTAAADYDTLLGYNAGHSITSGGSNLILGPNVASTTLQTGSGNILIGVSASTDTPISSTSNELLIQGNGTTPTLLATSINSSTPAITLYGTVTLNTLSTGTASTYACFTSGGQLISSATAC